MCTKSQQSRVYMYALTHICETRNTKIILIYAFFFSFLFLNPQTALLYLCNLFAFFFIIIIKY